MWSMPVPWLAPMIGPCLNSITAFPQSTASARPSTGSQPRCRSYHLTASLRAEVVSCTVRSPAAAGAAVSPGTSAAATAAAQAARGQGRAPAGRAERLRRRPSGIVAGRGVFASA